MQEHRLMRYFAYEHLPPRLAAVSKLFWVTAETLVLNQGSDGKPLFHDHAELTVALRKLLEAKDAAVRAALPLPDANEESAA
jgi:hypothetical protein